MQTILGRTSIRAQRRMGAKAQGRAEAVDEEVGSVPEQLNSGAAAARVSGPFQSLCICPSRLLMDSELETHEGIEKCKHEDPISSNTVSPHTDALDPLVMSQSGQSEGVQ